MVCGTVNLPHGTGKTKRVLVFATGDKAAAAEAAGADFVGADDLIDKVKDGWATTTPSLLRRELMGKVGQPRKGPRSPWAHAQTRVPERSPRTSRRRLKTVKAEIEFPR